MRITLLRDLKPAENYFLDEMLYEAVFVAEGKGKLPREIIKQPELSRYTADFGRAGDFCLVAEVKGQLVGAIWARLYTSDEKGYGYVNDQTPELSMALREQHRNQGIGRQLLNAMMRKLTEQKFTQVSLSVDKRNFAFDFYKKRGFKEVESTDNTAIMIKKLKQ